MAKGNTCPNCGRQMFHQEKAVRVCSACGAVGWDVTPGSAGAGKGSKCVLCGANTVRTVHDDKRGFAVKYCSTCKSTLIV
jgi:hypothetical protein